MAAQASLVTVTAYDLSGTAIFSTAPSITASTSGYVFIGVVTDVAISRINIVAGGPTAHETIDNLVFNPEPSTFALTALGLLGLAGVARRRRRKRAPATS